jgi:hypothetical protein
MEDILFKGMNIPNELKKEMDLMEKPNTYTMSDAERKAYLYCSDVMISTLRRMMNDNEHFIVHIKNYQPEELTIQELSDIYINRMMGYTE